MDESTLNQACRHLLIAIAAVVISAAAPAFSAGSTDDTISSLEKRFFFQTYGEDEVGKRLSRIEKRVFGDPMEGTVEERLSKLSSLAAPSVNPDGLQVKTPRAAAAAVAPAPVEQAIAPPPEATTKYHAAPSADEQQLAIERARVSVMAAKEQEIRELLAQGVQLWRTKRGAEAIEKFEQVVRLDPANAEAHFSMGIIEETQGSFVEALSSYRQAAKFRPNNKAYAEAAAAVEKKMTAKQQVVGQQSEIRLLAEDAVAAYRRGEFVSALDLYKQLDQKTPNQHLVKYNIGTVYMAMKLPDRALEFYKQALKLNPQEPRYAQVVSQVEGVLKGIKDQEKIAKSNYSGGGGGNTANSTAATNQSLLSGYGLNGKSGSAGVIVTVVGAASRASQVGLQRGDVIMAVDGSVVRNPKDINQIISRKGQGAQLQLMIQRDNQIAQVSL